MNIKNGKIEISIPASIMILIAVIVASSLLGFDAGRERKTHITTTSLATEKLLPEEEMIPKTELIKRIGDCLTQANDSYEKLAREVCAAYGEPVGENCALPKQAWDAIITMWNEYGQSCHRMVGW
jgi:hypothetical protein